MKRKSLYIASLLAAFTFFSGCTSNENNKKDDKAQYLPESNKVEVITLERGDFSRQLLSNGKLSATNRAELYFKTTGVLDEINVSNGAKVQKGALLAALEDKDLALNVESATLALKRAELELFDFLAGLGYAAGDTISMEKSVLEMAKMRSGYSEAKNNLTKSQITLAGSKVVAPFSGKVADLTSKRFERTGSEPFCTIIDDSSFDVDFTVMESEYSFLSKGLPVKVAPFADLTNQIDGIITTINPMVDKNGQITVRARIINDGTLVDGMNVKVIVERTIPNQLVVPKSAVVVRDYLDVLFTYGEDNKANWTYVKILHSNSDSHAVIANEDHGAVLNEGDKVIISGNLNLADGSSVEIKQ